jgi:hypothetical protein
MTENQAKKRARVVPVVVRPKWITELKSLANLESRGENKHKLYYRYIGLNKEVISGSPEYWDATTGRFSAPFNEFRKELIDDAIGFVYDNLDDAESELVMVRQLDDMVLSFLIMDIPPESPAQHAACIENNHYVYLNVIRHGADAPHGPHAVWHQLAYEQEHRRRAHADLRNGETVRDEGFSTRVWRDWRALLDSEPARLDRFGCAEPGSR